MALNADQRRLVKPHRRHPSQASQGYARAVPRREGLLHFETGRRLVEERRSGG
jgi:hypothetical protein